MLLQVVQSHSGLIEVTNTKESPTVTQTLYWGLRAPGFGLISSGVGYGVGSLLREFRPLRGPHSIRSSRMKPRSQLIIPLPPDSTLSVQAKYVVHNWMGSLG